MDRKSSWYLRLQLLKIWGVKNLKLFILSAALIFLIMAATGVFPTSFVEGIPVINMFCVEYNEVIGQINAAGGGWMTIISSLGAVFAVFSKKARSVKLPDITSNKLKLLLIKAGLKFDVNGNICLFSENNEKVENEPYLQRVKRAFHELKIILTAKVDNQADFNMIVEQNDMKAAKETADKIKDVVATLDVVAVEEDANGKKKKSKLHIAVSIKNFILKIVNKIRSHFTVEYEEGWGDEGVEPKEPEEVVPEVIPEPEEEVVVESSEEEVVVIEDNSVVPEAELIKEPVEEVKVPIQPEIKETVPTAKVTTSDDFIDRLKARKRR